jgi:membrane protein implicated in regulation of membrane protease activity
MSESSAVTQSAIVGRRGKVVFAVSADAGTVHVCDAHGTLHRVRARSEQGPLPAGTEVVVVAFEPTQRLFRVAHPETYVNAE